MAQQFVADGADAFESIAEALVGWIRAPGTVSLEVATEIAADLGALTAGLHAALADGRGRARHDPARGDPGRAPGLAADRPGQPGPGARGRAEAVPARRSVPSPRPSPRP